ncbi:protein kinase [Streptomyces sp. NPDC052095]|uniref:protein kinase domain-containing protein n=1 Tax=unclassified Streptomyces TaxID=2593676 RepID=UPI00344E7952
MWGRGTLIGDRYVLDGRLGQGAMGEVWRADDQVLHRPVAVKMLHPSGLEDNSFLPRFRREAKILAAIHHPGVVGVHDYGEQVFSGSGGPDGAAAHAAYIVMELVEGRTLEEVRAEYGLLPAARVFELAAEALDALHTVHRLGIVHRDIKPSNMMLRKDGRVAVTDFGIARAETDTRLTGRNAVIGTARYMAPEQSRGLPAIPASDLYSIGVVCYELLTGEPPFRGGSPVEVALKHIEEPVPDLPGDVSTGAREFIAKALAKDPEDRFVNAAVMAAAARRVAAGGAPAPVRDAAEEEERGRSSGTRSSDARPSGTQSPAQPRHRGRARRRPVIVVAALAVPVAIAAAVYLVPELTGSDFRSGVKRDVHPGTKSTAPSKLGAGWEDRGVIQGKDFPSTNTFWMADIDGDGKEDFLSVDKDQNVQLYRNHGPSDADWKPFTLAKTSYEPRDGSAGNTLRFADMDGDGHADCVDVFLDGRMSIRTWKSGLPDSSGMCMTRHTGTFEVRSWGSSGDLPSIDPKTRIRIADVTGGGRDDYLLIEPDGETTAWFNKDFVPENDQERLDWEVPMKISDAMSNTGTVQEIRYADLNGDARADRILVTAKGGAFAWLGEGDKGRGGTYKQIGRIAEDADVPPKDVQFADVDGDGRADFLRIGHTGITHAWLNRLKPDDFRS